MDDTQIPISYISTMFNVLYSLSLITLVLATNHSYLQCGAPVRKRQVGLVGP